MEGCDLYLLRSLLEQSKWSEYSQLAGVQPLVDLIVGAVLCHSNLQAQTTEVKPRSSPDLLHDKQPVMSRVREDEHTRDT